MHFSKFLALAFIASASAADQLQILAPGKDVWWVANSQNVIAWAPCPASDSATSSFTNFNFVVDNADQHVLSGNLTILATIPYSDCSLLYTPPTTLPPASGYSLFLTDPLNITNIFASTQFDIKTGAYPPTSREPQTIGPSTSGSSTADAPSPTGSTGQNNNNQATTITISVAVALMGVLNVILEGVF